ncbi:MAG: ATP-binding protein [Bacteroidales bacterium]|nr:ATP-binding protein [Bacteroidales bacterium]
MEQYIKNLIGQGEHQQLDFKFEISDAKKIARTFSAFANTNGGTLLVGVKDNGVISGIRTEEEDYMVESAAHLFCKPAVEYSTRKWNVGGKWVLEVTIPESVKKPTYAKTEEGKWMAYVRIKDENFLANVVMLNVWKLKNQKKGVYIRYGIKEKKVLKILKENEMLTSREIATLIEDKKYFVEKILAKLISINVVEIIFSEHSVFYHLQSPDELTS